MNGYRVSESQKAQADAKTKQKMIEWIVKNETVNSDTNPQFQITAQPVDKEAVDTIQGNLVKKIGDYNLEVKSITTQNKTSQDKKDNVSGVEFTTTVTGSWEDTMRYLNDLKREQALIVVKSANVEIEQNSSIKTTFKYKIFTL
ncbi:hypothetical protein SDC9_203674 [bioreactor metagenome]|uniref:Uncharacterized protein n=1 Tax=bioreactor metagenome TaxID=1076179 RepID=A0A645IYM4_9ZZZZ